MPTYAYRCADCGHSFDIYQSFSDATLTECPECGGDLRKVFGSLGVTFNGSGFYRTDSRASGSGGSGSSSGSGSGSSSSS
ncbi:putative FmdB family regulatory protein [Leucobacter komagatae]|uniref:Putative FmdB family regulatory protein n=1 Tax=Leucobacter komagatae TaxID=55969 RepID=A0A542Y662_9MICO|nr:FmdB family zinc ribbon protein [Leucobacter komagatae]TQL43582.1 putative FmdB family regulatory protein [Leucobacter komagatae]